MAVRRVEGVRDAQFSYDRAEGFVTFDTTATSPAAFIAELERMTDFSATVRSYAESMPESAMPGSETGDENEHEEDGGQTHEGEGGVGT